MQQRPHHQGWLPFSSSYTGWGVRSMWIQHVCTWQIGRRPAVTQLQVTENSRSPRAPVTRPSGEMSPSLLQKMLSSPCSHTTLKRSMTLHLHQPEASENLKPRQFDPSGTFYFLCGCLFFCCVWPEQVKQRLPWSDIFPPLGSKLSSIGVAAEDQAEPLPCSLEQKTSARVVCYRFAMNRI